MGEKVFMGDGENDGEGMDKYIHGIKVCMGHIGEL